MAEIYKICPRCLRKIQVVTATGFQNSGKGRRFTHWMPLPEPPKEET